MQRHLSISIQGGAVWPLMALCCPPQAGALRPLLPLNCWPPSSSHVHVSSPTHLQVRHRPVALHQGADRRRLPVDEQAAPHALRRPLAPGGYTPPSPPLQRMRCGTSHRTRAHAYRAWLLTWPSHRGSSTRRCSTCCCASTSAPPRATAPYAAARPISHCHRQTTDRAAALVFDSRVATLPQTRCRRSPRGRARCSSSSSATPTSRTSC